MPAQSPEATPASRSVEVFPRRINSPAVPVRLLTTVAWAGAGVSRFTAPPAPAGVVPGAKLAVVSPRISITPTVVVHLSPSPRHVRAPRAPGRPHVDHPARVAEALAADPRGPVGVPIGALVVAAVVMALALLATWTQTKYEAER